MLSWNATRPTDGKFLFYISVKTNEWSPWLLYALWGSEGQSGFFSETAECPVRVYQDAFEVLKGNKATAFQIKIVTEGGASLKNIHALHVFTNGKKSDEMRNRPSYSNSISLNVPGISQMTVNHARYKDLCSPHQQLLLCVTYPIIAALIHK